MIRGGTCWGGAAGAAHPTGLRYHAGVYLK